MAQSVGALFVRWQSTQSPIFKDRTCFTFVIVSTAPWQVEQVWDASTVPSGEMVRLGALTIKSGWAVR